MILRALIFDIYNKNATLRQKKHFTDAKINDFRPEVLGEVLSLLSGASLTAFFPH